MQTRVSSKGQIVLPKEVRRELGIQMGDALQTTVDPDHAHVILTPERRTKPAAVIIDDPVTGWPVLTFQNVDPDHPIPVLTSRYVEEILAKFA